jgi:outer membrane immunogenic protein
VKTFLVLAATMAAAFTTPAFASGEGRIEARGGIAFAGGSSEAFAGIGAGYDFDLGDKAFIGADLGADKILAGNTKVLFSVGARVGAKIGEKGRLYANGGIGFCCGTSDPYIGAGYQHKIGSSVYGKVEYRRILSNGTDVNFAGLGIGVAF